MIRRAFLSLFALLLLLALPFDALAGQEAYFPGPGGEWEKRSPEAAGIDPGQLEEAIRFAREHESASPRDLEENHYLGSFAREPHGEAIGPFKERGDQTGIVVRNGYLVAEWGEPERVDMTFSVTKSFLSTTVGLAWDDGLIGDVHDRVGPSMAPVDLPPGDGEAGVARGGYGPEDPAVLFASDHARKITWDHLLRQTSDWAGTLWSKPDWSDRPRGEPSTWRTRERSEPGTSYEYNDVRVNLLALAATNLWREPLPRVIRERVMDPIGASPTWRWHGYRNSWITLDGRRIQAVSGGGHWGGGMFITAYDQARLGLFTLHRGQWDGESLLSEEWFEMATTPTGAQPGYGYMNYFLNHDRERYPAAPATAYAHLGAGSNVVYVDPEHDLVVVLRWIQGSAVPEFLEKLLAGVSTVPG